MHTNDLLETPPAAMNPPQAGTADLAALMQLAAPFDQPRPSPSLAPDANFVRFYGLRENPFADSVNPGYFYKTDSHAEALQRMMVAIEQNVSLGMVTGLSGTGKTLVTQLLLQQIDTTRYHTILVLVSPGLSKTGLLREILSELSVAEPAGINRTQDLLKLLSNFIIDLHHKGQRLVILVDECHLLSADCLHIIRTISNIEIPERKLTTCLLFGEERFARRLEHASYDSLRNRMYLSCELRPMSVDDCEQYVKFRLMVAGRLHDLFDPAALAALHAHSGGVCRSLNKLCMLSLLEGALHGSPVIAESTVAAAAQM